MKANKSKIDIVFVPASFDDINAANEIMRDSLSHWNYTEDELDQIMDLFEINEQYIKDNDVKLAYHCEILIGFFAFKRNEHELDSFYIRKNLIGAGYGKIMWEECCRTAKELMMDYFVIMSTPYADGFYEKMGAKKFGSRPSRVREGVVLPLLKFYLSDTNANKILL